MIVSMKANDAQQQTTRISHSDHSGTRIQSPPMTPTSWRPMAVAANQAPYIRPLYFGGATRETSEIPIGLRNSSAIVRRK